MSDDLYVGELVQERNAGNPVAFQYVRDGIPIPWWSGWVDKERFGRVTARAVDAIDPVTALHEITADYGVSLEPCLVRHPETGELEADPFGEHRIYRNDTFELLGRCSEKWVDVPHQWIFDRVQACMELLTAEKVRLMTVGLLGKSGGDFFAGLDTGHTFEALKGDPIVQYGTLFSSRTAGGRCSLSFSHVAPVCRNTVNAAESSAEVGGSFQHTGDVMTKFVTMIGSVINGLGQRAAERDKEMLQHLASRKAPDARLNRLAEALYPPKPVKDDAGELAGYRLSKKAREDRVQFLAYNHGLGDNQAGRGTDYGVWQAFTQQVGERHSRIGALVKRAAVKERTRALELIQTDTSDLPTYEPILEA